MKTLFRIKSNLALLLIVIFASGCAQQQTYDYSALKASKPKSILVIPPMNDSVEVNAPYIFLSTITEPLAEKGYYVFPVAVIDQMLKDNGLSTPAEMHKIPLEKINQYISPDAVLYVNINEWGQKYQVINSKTVVEASMRLIDAKTGKQLWDGTAFAQESSDSGGGLAGALISAVVTQVVGNIVDYTPALSRKANYSVLNRQGSGILNGPYLNSSSK